MPRSQTHVIINLLKKAVMPQRFAGHGAWLPTDISKKRRNIMTTATELKTRILGKADEDSDFRARLISDPKTAISAETGTAIPEGFDVVVHEDSATTAHLVLPPSPKLTEAELGAVVGAGSTKGYYW